MSARAIFITCVAFAIVILIWALAVFTPRSCDQDCQFEQLQPPIILRAVSKEGVMCVDVKNSIWKGSLDYNVNREIRPNYCSIILESNYVQGDTIVFPLSDFQKGETLE